MAAPAQSSNWTPEEPSSSIGPDTSSRSDDSDFFAHYEPAKESHFFKNFKNPEVLGEGGFGIVYKVLNKTDQKEYAIKLIKLCQNDKKAVKEAEILSELNHGNVVRYYTAWNEWWISKESARDAVLSDSLSPSWIGGSDDTDENSVSSTTNGTHKDDAAISNLLASFRIGSSDDTDESSVSSTTNGTHKDDAAVSDALSALRIGSSDDTDENSVSSATNGKVVLCLFIQMELCRTNLRSVIDKKKEHEVDQLSQYLHELIEGLTYIHNKGYIHRDLNPNNVFIGYDNRIKIGDFGLARMHLHSEEHCGVLSKSVGTLMYRAPEVFTEKYDKRADIYSLAVIFFETLYPMGTGMERIKVLEKLKSAQVEFPEDFLDHASTWHKALLHSILNHNPEERPSLESISAQMSENCTFLTETKNRELVKNMFKETNICNRFNTLDGIKTPAPAYNFVTTLETIFRQHGASHFPTPLLTPRFFPKQSASAVELMTNTGMIVNLPHNPRENFAQYIVLNQINPMIRYDSFQTFEDQGVDHHPNQRCMSDFDIITCDPDLVVETDAQVLHLLVEIDKTIANMHSFYSNKQKNIFTTYLAINHADVVKSILLSVGVSENNLDNVLRLIGKEGFQGLDRKLSFPINMTKLERILDFQGIPAEEVERFVLQEVNEEYSPIVKKAFQCMNDTLKYLYDNIFCPGEKYSWSPLIDICLSSCSNVQLYSGILFSITAYDNRSSSKDCIVADGGRYDGMLQSLRSKFGLEEANTEKYGCGITVYPLHIANLLEEFIPPNLMVLACCKNTGSQKLVHQLTQYMRRAGFNCAPKIYNCDSEVKACREDPNVLCTIEILPSGKVKVTHQYSVVTSGFFIWSGNRNPTPPTIIVPQKYFLNTILGTFPTVQSPSGMFTSSAKGNPNPPTHIVSPKCFFDASFATDDSPCSSVQIAGREGGLE